MNDEIPPEREDDETVEQLMQESAGGSLPVALVAIAWGAAAYTAVLIGFAAWSLIF